MTTDDTDDETLETLAEYLRLNPDATTPEVLGATDTDPAVWGDVVDNALATAEPHLAVEAPDTDAPEGGFGDETPGEAQLLASASGLDVVHTHSHLYFSTNLATIRRRLRDTPLAITNHGLYSQNAAEWVFDLYLRTVGQWTFKQADVIFCYIQKDLDRVRELDVDSRIEAVANRIDTERFTPNGA